MYGEVAMDNLRESMKVFRLALQAGYLQQAYRGLIDFFSDLRKRFQTHYPEYFISSMYYGYLDMTYFAVVNAFLKERQLKIAIVFDYDSFSFEVWLSGVNREIQKKHWKLIKEMNWKEYTLCDDPTKEDHIIRKILVKEPDFSDSDMLGDQIEEGTIDFLDHVQAFMGAHA
jgi:hypothetical protein